MQLYTEESFNPHTHAGCDTILPQSWRSLPVSIHTPTQGVTQDKRQCKECLRVSIHTPTQGVTCQRLEYSGMALFQSTHPRRVWHSLNAKWEKGGSFNPHTHAGCDEEIWRRLYVQSCFNPHTHAGCDQKKWTVLTIKNSFNPHTHAGCDIVWYSLLTRQKSFNPHTHAGCDQRCKPNTTHGKFQSTHPRRVWPR